MRRHLSCPPLFVLLLALAPSVPALAEDPEADVTQYSFEDQAVLGDTIGPALEVLHARKRGDRESLVRARTQFVHELLKSVEQL